MTETDREALQRVKPAAQRLFDLPPFIDLKEWTGTTSRDREWDETALRFLTVAMMRPGDKLASYTILANALSRLRHHEWTLDIVGDGDARQEIERLFSSFAERVRFLGQIDDRARLTELYSHADLFLWPAVNEAYGMALLEAQAFGCPVIAGAYGGVASVVRDGKTGILTHPGDADAFARTVEGLIGSPKQRHALGVAAHRFVAEERRLQPAAERLKTALMILLTVEERR